MNRPYNEAHLIRTVSWPGYVINKFSFPVLEKYYQYFQNYAAPHRQNSRRESCNGLPSIKHDPSILSVLVQKNCPQINFNQSIIVSESFRSDWIEIYVFK